MIRAYGAPRSPRSHQVLRQGASGSRRELRPQGRNLLRPARPQRRRQDHDLGNDRRNSGAHLRRGPVPGQCCGSAFQEKIGIQFQNTSLPDHLRVREVLEYFPASTKARRHPRVWSNGAPWASSWTATVSELSGGQRQRLLLALGLINDPELIFLDEPTTGLDPQARRNFWELVQEIKSRGKTVLLTTHYMEEAYVLCDEIAIMDHGKIIAQGRPINCSSSISRAYPSSCPRGRAHPAQRNPGQGFRERWCWRSRPIRWTKRSRCWWIARCRSPAFESGNGDLEDLFLELTGKAIR